MRLCYFASPYELLDVNRPGQDRHFTREGKIKLDCKRYIYISRRVCSAIGVVNYDLRVNFCLQI